MRQRSIFSNTRARNALLPLLLLLALMPGLCLAAPASVHPLDASAGQEDFQALTFPAAEKLERILEGVELIVAAELLAARQARELRGTPLPPRLEAVVERLEVAPVTEDRSFTPDLERLRALVRSGALLAG